MNPVITGVNLITAVGNDAVSTAAAVRADISGLVEFDKYFDTQGNKISAATFDICVDEADEMKRLETTANHCIRALLDQHFAAAAHFSSNVHLLIGTGSETRPGPPYSKSAERTVEVVRAILDLETARVIASGNVSVIRCFDKAIQLLNDDPTCICIVGGMDTLLAIETLDWLEKSQRLRSETFGRNQALAPGEAVGFVLLEERSAALERKSNIVAEFCGLGLSVEPAPFLSTAPSKGEGLTLACREALSQSGIPPSNIRTAFGDLDGEFYRSKEWAYAGHRCYGGNSEMQKVFHPADCLGSVGGASAAVLAAISAVGFLRGWILGPTMIFCSDDEGERGSLILRHPMTEHRGTGKNG